ncbi:hypothetical protein VCHA54O485_40197 [Vibrio chagasii]|nr:hypothetical protein VCHA55P509_40197 [Vibrio chagasii]CAH7289214.1 hypothetical protein VCHA54O485_40197 [Vibrio chagasii]CAH7463153.1 hypothetical protein VCHA54P501_40220 [Vibrio chagasii]
MMWFLKIINFTSIDQPPNLEWQDKTSPAKHYGLTKSLTLGITHDGLFKGGIWQPALLKIINCSHQQK